MELKASIEKLINQGYSLKDITDAFNQVAEERESHVDKEYDEAAALLSKAFDLGEDFNKDLVMAAAVLWALDQHENWGEDEVALVKGVIKDALGMIEQVAASVMDLGKKLDSSKSKDNDAKAVLDFLRKL